MHGDLGDFMRGWVYVKSEALEPDALLKALKAGHYYSSTGAQLHHVAFSGRDKLVVECSSAEQILLTGDRAGVLARDSRRPLDQRHLRLAGSVVALAARDGTG